MAGNKHDDWVYSLYENIHDKLCQVCGKSFPVHHKTQSNKKYCSSKCSQNKKEKL
jgi:hypothetical protein